MLDVLDASAIRRWSQAAVESMAAHRDEIDDLNVFPIPDGDTGTNLELTLRSAAEAVAADRSAAAGQVLRAMARGAVLGARGNSGVIVSQVLCGLADALDGQDEADGQALTAGLRLACDLAYAAVAEPVEGTVLSVLRSCAEAAEAAGEPALPAMLSAIVAAAEQALRRTPEQLDVLAAAGVVDAGGRGLVVLLAELAAVVTGEPAAVGPAARRPRDRAALRQAREAGSAEYGYEVQYLLDADEDAVAKLKSALGPLGDSLVVVGSGRGSGLPVWNVHIHVNDVGAAIEAGIEAGRPHRISVTRFADQMAAAPAAPTLDAQPFDAEARGLVVVAAGPGLAEIFAAEGATVVPGGPTNNPSMAEVLEAVRATRAGRVALLPNDSNVLAVAQLAAEEARGDGIRVGVVPTKSPVQAMAAIAVRDASKRFHDDVIGMAEAAGACRYAEVTVATREALTVAGRCQPGDILGLVEGEVNVIGTDLASTSATLLDRMLAGGGEMVTLVLGADAPVELGDFLTAHLAQAWPFADVKVYHGGQPHYPLLAGVE